MFYHDASKHIDSGMYKQKITHTTASNQPAWPQTIVTVASLVTSWLLL